MTALSRKDYRGYVVGKKISGSGALAVGTQVTIPCEQVICNNPTNSSYPLMINAEASISNGVLGKRTPNITLRTAWKNSWVTADLLNSWLTSADSNLDTDEWAWGIFDGAVLRAFSGCKCAGLSISANAAGGDIAMEIPFIARYDHSQAGTPTSPTFTAGVVDPGLLTPVSQINFGNTADLVSGFQLQILRAQGYLPFFDQTLFMAGVASGVLTGTMSIVQSPTATTVPSSGVTLQIGQTGAGVQIITGMNLDAPKRDYAASLGSMADIYSLVDLSGNGNIVVISAL